MNILTFPKIEIERKYHNGEKNKDKILISILSSVDSPLERDIINSYSKSLELRFDDIPFNVLDKDRLNPSSDFYGCRSFAEIDYYLIKDFFEKEIKDFNGTVEIHCTAGVSRSGAVAVGLSVLKNDIHLCDQIFKDNAIIPNQLILSHFIQKDLYMCEFDLIHMYKIILNKEI